MELVSENRCFGGVQGVYKHKSSACRGEMTFAVYMPPQAEHSTFLTERRIITSELEL